MCKFQHAWRDCAVGECVAARVHDDAELLAQLEWWAALTEQPLARVLHVTTDEQSQNRTAFTWLQQRPDVLVQWGRDPHHRLWNDVRAAVAASPLESAYLIYMLALPTYSSVRGRRAAEEVAKDATSEDAHFKSLWSSILADDCPSVIAPHHTPRWEDSASGRDQCLRALPHLPCLRARGGSAGWPGPVRWSQLLEVDELAAGGSASRPDESEHRPKRKGKGRGRGQAEIPGERETTASTDNRAHAVPPAASVEKRLVDAKARAFALKSRCRNSLEFAARVLADVGLTQSCRQLALCTAPLHQLYRHWVEGFRSISGCHEIVVNLARGEWLCNIEAMWEVLNDNASLHGEDGSGCDGDGNGTNAE
eukprot:1346777-Amphidinium_carterae.1